MTIAVGTLGRLCGGERSAIAASLRAISATSWANRSARVRSSRRSPRSRSASVRARSIAAAMLASRASSSAMRACSAAPRLSGR